MVREVIDGDIPVPRGVSGWEMAVFPVPECEN